MDDAKALHLGQALPAADIVVKSALVGEAFRCNPSLGIDLSPT